MPVLDHEELLFYAQQLEPLPMSASRLASLVADPNADMEAIVETVSLDQALTVRALRAANAAVTGGSRGIATVEQAVVRLGTGAILSMAVAAGVRGRMMGPVEGYDLEEGELWSHSVASALAAESMAGLAGVPIVPECFTAALLHDVGKLILGRALKPEVKALLDRVREEKGVGAAEAESEVLELDHAQLGGRIATQWDLPRTIVAGIEFHHRPEACQNDELATIAWTVHLADLVARSLGRTAGEQEPGPEERAPGLERLGLDEVKFEKLLFRTSLRLDQVTERFS